MIETKYVILPAPPPSDKLASSRGTRYNNDRSKVILKFDGPVPEAFKSEELLTHEQIMKQLEGPEWQSNII